MGEEEQESICPRLRGKWPEGSKGGLGRSPIYQSAAEAAHSQSIYSLNRVASLRTVEAYTTQVIRLASIRRSRIPSPMGRGLGEGVPLKTCRGTRHQSRATARLFTSFLWREL